MYQYRLHCIACIIIIVVIVIIEYVCTIQLLMLCGIDSENANIAHNDYFELILQTKKLRLNIAK